MEITIDEALKKGIKAHGAGQIHEADKCYTAILNSQPKHPDANHNLGILAVAAGKPELGLNYLKTAVDVNPDIEQYWISYISTLAELNQMDKARIALGQALARDLQSEILDQISTRINSSGQYSARSRQDPSQQQLHPLITAFDKGQQKVALQLVHQLLLEYPQSVMLHNIQGAIYATLEQFDDAIISYGVALEINPRYADGHNNLGLALRSQGKLDAAMRSYAKAIKLNPAFAEAHNNMGLLLSVTGENNAAEKSYQKAIKNQPEFAEAYFNLAGTLKTKGALDQAMICYRKAISIAPDYADAYNNSGLILAQQGELNLAIDHYREALNINSELTETHNNLGVALMNKGELDAAIESYKNAVDFRPNFFEAFNNFGLALQEQGETDEAIAKYRHALKINPEFPQALSNLGISLKASGDLKGALGCYHQALRINPNFSDALHNMGKTLAELGNFGEAIDCYSRALQTMPENAAIHSNLGNAFLRQGDIDRAIKCFSQTANLKPGSTDAYNSLGNAFRLKKDTDNALDSFKRALELDPQSAETYNNMGNAHIERENLAEAVENYRQALNINPDLIKAHYNLGIGLSAMGQTSLAIDSYEQALTLNPNHAETHNNLGNIHRNNYDLERAVNSYNMALAINPTYAAAHHNLGLTLKDNHQLDEAIKSFQSALDAQPDYDEACAQKMHLKAQICDWTSLEEHRGVLANLGIGDKEVTPFTLLALEDVPERHRLRAETYAKNTFKGRPLTPPPSPKIISKQLRIGYFSADFRNHPVSSLITRMFELHNRENFNIYAYSYGPDVQDEMQQRVIAAVDKFHPIGCLTDLAVAKLAHEDKLDIAIDLTGYTQHSRTSVFAYRVAPIQINYLGYPSTSGADFMDYIVTDEVIVPRHNYQYYSEKKIRLPNTYMVTDNTRHISNKVITRSQMHLPENGFVFCCFNSTYKITRKEFDIWMRLLLRIEGSVLWLRHGNKQSEEILKREAKLRGVAPNRLVFARRIEMSEHLARHRLADLFLDTFTFNAHSTAIDALWTGLPVITKLGKGFAGRVSASLLNAVGLSDLVTTSEQSYEALALELATNSSQLRDVKNKLSVNRLTMPLFNTEQFTRDFENAYQQIYYAYCEGNEPDDIDIRH